MLSRRLLIGLSISLPIFVLAIYAGSHLLFSSATATFRNQNYSTVNSSLTSKQLDPPIELAPAKTKNLQTAVFAGGCFWGVESVFEHLQGVSKVVSGYSGGSQDTANYETVSNGKTEHAEAVKITYDPADISYEQLLKVFFLVAHDPTELDRQGPDSGTQYRSAIFFTNNDQKQVAQAYLDRLTRSHIFTRPIVTKMAPLDQFYPAETYHQDFITHHPAYPYVVINDLPKLDRLRQQFPKLVKGF
jgi:peptide-methionine (S)-S-oxide reductase